eukprot:g43198.t1
MLKQSQSFASAAAKSSQWSNDLFNGSLWSNPNDSQGSDRGNSSDSEDSEPAQIPSGVPNLSGSFCDHLAAIGGGPEGGKRCTFLLSIPVAQGKGVLWLSEALWLVSSCSCWGHAGGVAREMCPLSPSAAAPFQEPVLQPAKKKKLTAGERLLAASQAKLQSSPSSAAVSAETEGRGSPSPSPDQNIPVAPEKGVLLSGAGRRLCGRDHLVAFRGRPEEGKRFTLGSSSFYPVDPEKGVLWLSEAGRRTAEPHYEFSTVTAQYFENNMWIAA